MTVHMHSALNPGRVGAMWGLFGGVCRVFGSDGLCRPWGSWQLKPRRPFLEPEQAQGPTVSEWVLGERLIICIYTSVKDLQGV